MAAFSLKIRGFGELSRLETSYNFFNPMTGDCKILNVYDEIKTDNSLNDKILENLQPDNLIIRDLGFFNQKIFRKIEEKEAFFLSRLSPIINVYQNENDKNPINLHQMMSERYSKFKPNLPLKS